MADRMHNTSFRSNKKENKMIPDQITTLIQIMSNSEHLYRFTV
jgi:hypothetical protein